MPKILAVIFILFCLLILPSSSFAFGDVGMEETPKAENIQISETPITTGYSSYKLYDMFKTAAHEYWSAFYDELDKTNALGHLASALIVFSFCLMAGKVLIGKGFDSMVELIGVMVLTGVSLSFLQSKEYMEALVFGFAIKFPLEVSSFFMDIAGAGNADVISQLSGWEKAAAKTLDFGSVKGLFDALDGNFDIIWDFYQAKSPEGIIIYTHPFTTLVVITFMLIMYAMIYLQFLITYIRSTALILVCSILAPFFGAIIAFTPAKKAIVTIFKTVYYHWLVMIVSTIVLGLFMATTTAFVADLINVQSPSMLVGEIIFTIIWFIIAYQLLTSVPSFVSQITEMRGISGGIGAVGITAGAAYMTSKVLKGGAKAVSAANQMKKGADKRFKDKQKDKQNP